MSGTPIQTDWKYPTTVATLDKHGARTAVRKGSAAELIGMDMQFDGGLRPFAGFHLYHNFSTAATIGQSVLGATIKALTGATAATSISGTVAWMKPVQFRVGDNRYGFGFIYATETKLYADFWYCDVGEVIPYSFSRCLLLNFATDPAPICDASVFGQFIFVFVQGQNPILINFLEAGGVQIVTTTGPGAQPQLADFHNDPGSGGLGIPSYPTPGYGRIFTQDADPGDSEHILPAGGYTFAYKLFDSRTGRWSALSEVATFATADFTADNQYVGLGIKIDSTKYDTIYMYRSVRLEDAGTVLYGAAILQLDQIVEGVADSNYNEYFYTLADGALVQQEPYVDFTLYDQNMPAAGTGIIHEGTAVVATNAAMSRQPTGAAEIRWSSPYELSPELFSAASRYLPSTPTDGVLKFVRVASSVIGFSGTRQYMMNRYPGTFHINEMNAGYGIVSRFAADVQGNQAYIVCNNGVKIVDVGGSLASVTALDYLIQNEWAGRMGNVSVAYDSVMNVLFIQNPDAQYDTTALQGGSCAMLWFNSGRVSELYDMNFLLVQSGPAALAMTFDGETYTYPNNYGNVERLLVDRALFLTRNNRVLVVDNLRQSGTRTFFPVSGITASTTSLRATVTARSGTTVTVDGASGEGTSPWSSGISMPGGFKVYILDGTNVGYSTWVSSISTNVLHVTSGTGLFFTVGDKVGISPVFAKWTGHLIGMQTQIADGRTFDSESDDFFQVRHVEAVSCAFADVKLDGSTTITSTNPKFRAGLYKANDAGEFVQVAPVTNQRTTMCSIVTGPSANLAAFYNTSDAVMGARPGVDVAAPYPSITINCPGLDFRLLGVKVHGRIMASDRTARAT